MRRNILARAVGFAACSFVLGVAHGSAFVGGRAVRFLSTLGDGTITQLKAIVSGDLLDLPYYASGIGMVLAIRLLAYPRTTADKRRRAGLVAGLVGITAAIAVTFSVLLVEHRQGAWPLFLGLFAVLSGCGAAIAWLAATCWSIGRGTGREHRGGAVVQASILWVARAMFVAASLRALDLGGEDALWGVIPLGMLAAESVVIAVVVTTSALLSRRSVLGRAPFDA